MRIYKIHNLEKQEGTNISVDRQIGLLFQSNKNVYVHTHNI